MDNNEKIQNWDKVIKYFDNNEKLERYKYLVELSNVQEKEYDKADIIILTIEEILHEMWEEYCDNYESD
jgi:hypothetical protein